MDFNYTQIIFSNLIHSVHLQIEPFVNTPRPITKQFQQKTGTPVQSTTVNQYVLICGSLHTFQMKDGKKKRIQKKRCQ